MNRKNRSYRQKLWDDNPRCHWCGCVTTIPDRHARSYKDFKPNDATLDHMFSKLDARRGTTPAGTRCNVLACRKCNNDRARATELAQPKSVLHARSASFPLKNYTIEQLLEIESKLLKKLDRKKQKSLQRVRMEIESRKGKK